MKGAKLNSSAPPVSFSNVMIRAVILACIAPLISNAWGADAGRQLGRVKVKALNEISGIAVSRTNPEIVWMHNDGESRQIYAVKSSGAVMAQLRAPRGIDDLEDIALGPGPDSERDYLYLGDIGDNDGDRRSIQVFRLLEPRVGSSGQEVAEQIDVITLTYPDGPHDAEALLVDPVAGDIVVATKENRRTNVYVAAGGGSANSQLMVLRKIAMLNVDQISAGDISRDGRLVALRSEEQGWLWQRRASEPLEETLSRQPRPIPVLGGKQGRNGEAIAFSRDAKSYFTMSEGKNESLYSFPVPTAAQ